MFLRSHTSYGVWLCQIWCRLAFISGPKNILGVWPCGRDVQWSGLKDAIWPPNHLKGRTIDQYEVTPKSTLVNSDSGLTPEVLVLHLNPQRWIQVSGLLPVQTWRLNYPACFLISERSLHLTIFFVISQKVPTIHVIASILKHEVDFPGIPWCFQGNRFEVADCDHGDEEAFSHSFCLRVRIERETLT